jgi:hypothetical protein
MGQLELSEGREFMDLLKLVLHAEALGIALCWAIGCCPYVLIATAESTPSARTGKLAPLGADIIYHRRRHRSSLGMGSRLRVKMATESASRRALRSGRHGTGRRIREWLGRRYRPGYSQGGRTRGHGRSRPTGTRMRKAAFFANWPVVLCLEYQPAGPA